MKITETPLDEFIAFLSNNLPRQEMKQVKHNLLASGEADAVYHCLMADYEHHRDYIDQLIGQDEEENIEQIEKTFQKSVRKRKEPALYSQTTNRNTNHLNKIVMKATKEELQQLGLPENFETVMNAVDTLTGDIQEMMRNENADYKAVAKQRLMKKYDLPEEKAEEIIEKLQKGIDLFDSQYADFQQGNIQVHINQLLDGKTDEEKKNLLVNALASMQVMQLDIDQQSDENIQKAIEAYGQKTIEELVAELEAKLQEGAYFDTMLDFAASLSEPLDEEKLASLHELLATKSDAYKFYTALLLYTAQVDKTLGFSLGGEDLSVEAIGACAAAAVALEEVKAECADEAEWRVKMKHVFGALYMVLLYTAGIVFIAAASVLLITTLMTLFGQGILAAFISLGIALVLGHLFAEKFASFAEWSLEKLEKPYDWVVDHVVVLVGKVKEKIAQVCAARKAEKEQPLENKKVVTETGTKDKAVQEEKAKAKEEAVVTSDATYTETEPDEELPAFAYPPLV